MAKVTIIKPNITPEEERKALEDISRVLESIVAKEYGREVKVSLERIKK